jgi:hypothetical protein
MAKTVRRPTRLKLKKYAKYMKARVWKVEAAR